MNEDSCPRCEQPHLRRWDELNEEEQEVVRRLPASVEYPAAERETRHRWCSRCWFEATDHTDLRSHTA